MNEPAVIITGVTKKYRSCRIEISALRVIDLSVEAGAFWAVAGPPVPARRRCSI